MGQNKAMCITGKKPPQRPVVPAVSNFFAMLAKLKYFKP